MTAYVQIPISNRVLHFYQDESTAVAERIVAAMESGRPSRFSHLGGYLVIDFTALGSVEVMSDQPVDYDSTGSQLHAVADRSPRPQISGSAKGRRLVP